MEVLYLFSNIKKLQNSWLKMSKKNLDNNVKFNSK